MRFLLRYQVYNFRRHIEVMMMAQMIQIKFFGRFQKMMSINSFSLFRLKGSFASHPRGGLGYPRSGSNKIKSPFFEAYLLIFTVIMEDYDFPIEKVLKYLDITKAI